MKIIKALVFILFFVVAINLKDTKLEMWQHFLVVIAGGAALGWLFKVIEDKKDKNRS